jgi:hypothetical protein
MYKINSTTIENDVLVTNVTIIMEDGYELVCNVPVRFPKSKDEVFAAINARESAEMKKYDAAPVLEGIKAEIDGHVEKVQGLASISMVK